MSPSQSKYVPVVPGLSTLPPTYRYGEQAAIHRLAAVLAGAPPQLPPPTVEALAFLTALRRFMATHRCFRENHGRRLIGF